MRKCTNCQEEKEESNFFKKNGAVIHCGTCYECDRKHQNAIRKKSRDKNIEKARESRNKYRAENKDEINRKNREWRSKNKEKQREVQRTWAKNNVKKRNSYVSKWINKSPENKQKRKNIALKYYRKTKEERNNFYLLSKMRRNFRRICDGEKARKSFEYIGVSSVEDFISKMSSKTDNPNWLKDGYEIDHIWQINWVSDYCNLHEVDKEKLYSVIHSHLNVRPLSKQDNGERSKYDFTPLVKEDYSIYEPFLDERIKVGLDFYWSNPHLFSGETLKRGSNEEKIIIDYIRSFKGWPS